MTALDARADPDPVETEGESTKPRRQTGVYDALFQDIVTGKLQAGERLLIDDLAERFGVSKIPVREALKALEGRGWVESAPRRGTYVRRLSQEELHELFELRSILEPEMTAMAAHRRRAVHLQELVALIEEGEAAVRASDFVTSSRVNSQFHSVIAQAADNSLAYAIIQDLELRLCRYFFVAEWEERKESILQHRVLFEAIRDQDIETARKVTIAHLRHTEAMASRSLLSREMARLTKVGH